MNFKRKQSIEQSLVSKRVLLIYGPRRVGKTTMVNNYLKTISSKKTRYDVGDDIELRSILGSQKRKEILEYVAPYEVVVIDEAQQIPNIGMAAKMMIDEYGEKNIILTGSSSFDLSQQAGEPLTGRHYVLTLFPISQAELDCNNFDRKQNLDNFLIFGSYPEVVLATDKNEKIKILRELVSSYLFKDILALDRLRSSELLLDITKCLAFQIGNEVSYNEIANTVKSDVKTVQRYIEVLEKAFVVRKLRAYNSNQRVEISKNFKYFFYDNGVRNAVINQWNDLANRNDKGALWENFILMELMKKNNIENKGVDFYFWRTKSQQKVDIIKDEGGVLTAYECKFSEKKTEKNFDVFTKYYPDAQTTVVNKENYLEFLL